MARVAAVMGLLVGLAAAGLAASAQAPRTGGANACPLREPKTIASPRSGSDSALVPDRPATLLVCGYSGFNNAPDQPSQGPPGRLISDGWLRDSAQVGRLAGQLNAIPPQSGPIACPADFGNQLVAYFRYPSGPEDPVSIGLSGCQSISNGHLNRVGLNRPVVSDMAALARSAVLRGHLRVCGGPAPGPCRTETLGGCGPPHGWCATSDRVAVLTTTGRRLVVVRLRRARFSVLVPGGRYRLDLLADGKHIHGRVLQTRRATARAGHTTTVVFRFDVP